MVVLNQLRECFCRTSVRNLSLTGELVRLLRLFKRHSVKAIPLKGPSLALSLYGNLALRPFSDLDVLVPKQEIDNVKRLLIGAGYSLKDEMTSEEEIRHLESDYYLAFRQRQREIDVEIHWQILHGYLRGRVGIDAVWSHTAESTLGGEPALALPPEELLLVLSIHGQKHEWERLKWLGDIARLIDVHPNIDWARVVQLAALVEQERAILMGCFLAASFLGVQLPERIQKLLRGNKSYGAHAGLIRGRLFRSKHNLPGFREWLAYVQRVDAEPRDTQHVVEPLRLLQYLLAISAPNSGDRFELRVPRPFSFLHYIHRPVRLFRRHGVALVDRLR
jgi:hypothetical protein